MRNLIEIMVRSWDITDRDPETNIPKINYPLLNLQIRYLAKKLFDDYEPTKGPYLDFLERLIIWLKNVDIEEDKKILFQLIPNIFFVGREEFDTLYRVAFNGPIATWIIEELKMPLNERKPETVLQEGVSNTWFCPLTDSFHISSFCHINRIAGISYRPDWQSLIKFGNLADVGDFIHKKNIKRVVLLEDFVGSGSQVLKVVKSAAETFKNIEILFLPLIVCPDGANGGMELENRYENITFSTVIPLREDGFVVEIPNPSEPELFSKIRDLVLRTYQKVSGLVWPHNGKPHGPFGYGNTGGLIVMYSNCPDNTLPIIHHKSDTWEPLFPRSART